MSSISDVNLFLSFDMDNDQDLHDRLLAQSSVRHSGFAVSAQSESPTNADCSDDGLRDRIRSADEVVVICGERTSESLSVRKELRIAQEEEKPYFLLWGRRECMCTKPEGAKPGDSMYTWIGELLLDRINATLRIATKPPPKTPKVVRAV